MNMCANSIALNAYLDEQDSLYAEPSREPTHKEIDDCAKDLAGDALIDSRDDYFIEAIERCADDVRRLADFAGVPFLSAATPELIAEGFISAYEEWSAVSTLWINMGSYLRPNSAGVAGAVFELIKKITSNCSLAISGEYFELQRKEKMVAQFNTLMIAIRSCLLTLVRDEAEQLVIKNIESEDGEEK